MKNVIKIDVISSRYSVVWAINLARIKCINIVVCYCCLALWHITNTYKKPCKVHVIHEFDIMKDEQKYVII